MESGALSYYSLFCGVFLFQGVRNENAGKNFVDWSQRPGGTGALTDYLRKNYYENYLSNIVPGISERQSIKRVTSASLLRSPASISMPLNSAQLKLKLSNFDVYLFPEGVGVFAMKIEPDAGQTVEYDTISKIHYHIRNPSFLLTHEQRQLSVVNLIHDLLSESVILKDNWSAYIPQLKTYSIINDNRVDRFDEGLDRKLFCVAHAMSVDAWDSPQFAPSAEYYAKVFNENTINIFANWKGICLFDSFTRISCSFPDTYASWEQEYFLIYIHCLYTKFQLYNFNAQLKDVSQVSRHTASIRNKFVEFVNDYNLAYISYKFLPNHLYESMNRAVDIQKEIERMELKIGRLHEADQERKSRQTNQILFIISILSIFSVIADLSGWLERVGLSQQIVYSPILSTLILLLLLGLIVLIIRRK